MKVVKKLFALIAAVSMVGTSVFAADFRFDEKIEYDATTDEKIYVSFYGDDVTDIGADSSLTLYYDKDCYTFDQASSTINYGTVMDTQYGVAWSTPNGQNVDISGNKCIMTLAFAINENKNPAEEDPFSIDAAQSCTYDSTMTVFHTYDGLSIAVTSAKPADPVPGTVGTKDGYTTVVDSDKATRFVVTDTKASIAATAASVLKVTYDGDTQSANLYKLLGVENAENAGNITIGSLTIKMILSADVQDVADIADYSFVIE